MSRFLLIILLAVTAETNAQQAKADSMRLVQVFDHTLLIPASFQHISTDSTWCGSGYITDGIDTLMYSRCMAIMPMMYLMIEPYCSPYEDTTACAAERAKVRAKNDSIRAEDPRIGTYYYSCEHGDGCWYQQYSPMPGVVGYFALEISAEYPRRESFLLCTTNIDLERRAVWRGILESVST